MPQKIVRVQDGDYKLVVGSNNAIGVITFDTNPGNLPGSSGGVVITGDLTVMGNTTTIQSETLTVLDPIIVANTSGFISPAHLGGLQIIRAVTNNEADIRSPVSLYWDETYPHFDKYSVQQLGTFKFVKDDIAGGTLQALAVAGLQAGTNDDLVLSFNGTGIIKVAGSAGHPYEEKILNYDLIQTSYTIVTVKRIAQISTIVLSRVHGFVPGDRVNILCPTDGTFNASFVNVITTPTDVSFTYANIGPVTAEKSVIGIVKPDILTNDDAVPNMRAVADFALIAASGLLVNKIQEDDTKVQVFGFNTSGVNKVQFEVAGERRVVISETGFTSDNIRISDNGMSNVSNDNIVFDSVLNIPSRTSTPSTPAAGHVKLYAKNTPGTGGTGLFFRNTQGTSDELISKTKALLYSLIL